MLLPAAPALVQTTASQSADVPKLGAPTRAAFVVAPLLDASAAALSEDGTTLVGTSDGRAFAWRVGESEARILSAPGAAYAVSADGSVVVGNGLQPGQGRIGRHRWIGTIPSIPPPYGPRIGGIAAGVSADGVRVVGSAILNYEVTTHRNGERALGFGEAAILRLEPGVDLDVTNVVPDDPRKGLLVAAAIPGEATEPSSNSEIDPNVGSPTGPGLGGFELGWGSAATAISPDGGTVVGTFRNPGRAFRWTPIEGVQELGDLPGGKVETIPLAVDRSGAIVGSARSANGIEAFLWTAKDGMIGLGDLPGNVFRSSARAVSAGGELVVGAAFGASIGESNAGARAFLWDRTHGMRDLWQLLKEQSPTKSGLPARFDRWSLLEAVSVRLTRDGHPQIAGSARDAGGKRVAFVATLDETFAP